MQGAAFAGAVSRDLQSALLSPGRAFRDGGADRHAGRIDACAPLAEAGRCRKAHGRSGDRFSASASLGDSARVTQVPEKRKGILRPERFLKYPKRPEKVLKVTFGSIFDDTERILKEPIRVVKGPKWTETA